STRRVQLAGVVQRWFVSSVRDRQRRRRGKLFLQSRDERSRARIDTIRVSTGQRLLHSKRQRHDGRHHAPGHERSDAVQIWERNWNRSDHIKIDQRKIERRRQTERAAFVPEDRKSVV